MAALTWRNVDAPDFRPSMEGYQTFSRLLDNAFGGLQQGLGRYDRAISDRVNTALQLRLAGAADADAARGIISNLATDPNANRISAATIDMATARPGQLINEAMNRENLGWTQYQHGRVKGFDTAEDAAAPLVADRLAAYAQGKGAEWEAAHPDAFKGLSMAARTQMYTQGQQARLTDLDITGRGISNEGARIGNRQAEFNLETGQWRFGNEKLDRSRSEAVNNYLSKYAASGGALDPNFVNSDPEFAKLDGTSQMLIRSQLGGVMGGGGGSFGGGSTPSGNGNASALGLTYGGGQLPESIQTVGQLVDNKSNLVRSLGASPVGVYQINADTWADFAPKVLGPNWRNAPVRDMATQEAVAQRIFQSLNGNGAALWNKARGEGRWAALGKYSQEQINQIAKMPWEKARQYIAQGESGANPAALLIGQTLANQGAKNQYMQQNSGSIAEPIQAALTDTTDLVTVATGLANGALKGVPQRDIMNRIQQIQAMGNGGRNPVQISPAAAAIILQRSAGPNNSWLPNRFNSDALNDNFAFQRDTAKSYVDQLRTGDYQRQVVTNQAINLRSQQVQSAEQVWSQARARLQAAQQQAAGNPRFDRSVLGRLSIAEAAAAENYRAAIAVAGTSAQAAGGMGRSAIADAPSGGSGRAAPARSSDRTPAATLLDQAGSTMLDQARAARLATGARRINLSDQFERRYGITPAQGVISHFDQMTRTARAAKAIGGVAGRELRESFENKYGMSPETALKRFSR